MTTKELKDLSVLLSCFIGEVGGNDFEAMQKAKHIVDRELVASND